MKNVKLPGGKGSSSPHRGRRPRLIHACERWMYRQGRPNRWARGLNRFWAVVHAAGGRAILRHGRREAVRLEEIEPGMRAPILRRYLSCAPGARPHIPIDRDAPLEDFEKIAAQIPVFRLAADQSDLRTSGI